MSIVRTALVVLAGVLAIVGSIFIVTSEETEATAYDCDYGGSKVTLYGEFAPDICRCLTAVVSGQERSIEDFVCGPGGVEFSEQKVAYQVIFDRQSREIDSEVEAYIQSLYDTSLSGASFASGVADIEARLNLSSIQAGGKAGAFTEKYRALCGVGEGSVLQLTSIALKNQTTDGPI